MSDPTARSHETLLLDRPAEHVLVVTLNRPAAANALNTRMGLDLMEVFEAFQLGVHGVRAIVLTGPGSAGPRHIPVASESSPVNRDARVGAQRGLTRNWVKRTPARAMRSSVGVSTSVGAKPAASP